MKSLKFRLGWFVFWLIMFPPIALIMLVAYWAKTRKVRTRG